MHSFAGSDLILINGNFHTLDRENPIANATAIRDGRFLDVGDIEKVMRHWGTRTRIIDLDGDTVIPGLPDMHLHVNRGGLNYNLESCWEGLPSLAEALRMLKRHADSTPSPQWIRVVGEGECQFAERQSPTFDELNAAAHSTPVFLLYLNDCVLLNWAALQAICYTPDMRNPPAGKILRDRSGKPIGMLIARANARLLDLTLAHAHARLAGIRSIRHTNSCLS